MRFSTSMQLHINHHLKAHLGYKSCPSTLGTEDLVYGGTPTHDLVVESPVPYLLGHPPLPTKFTYVQIYVHLYRLLHSSGLSPAKLKNHCIIIPEF